MAITLDYITRLSFEHAVVQFARAKLPRRNFVNNSPAVNFFLYALFLTADIILFVYLKVVTFMPLIIRRFQ